MTGVDLSDVNIHRGDVAETRSAELSARAFTASGEVYLPAKHGSLTLPSTQSLLTHELVHVAQQREYGEALPPEDSPAGAMLEAGAVAAEHDPEATMPLIRPHVRHEAPRTPAATSSPPFDSRQQERLASAPHSETEPRVGLQRAPEAASTPPVAVSETLTSAPPASPAGAPPAGGEDLTRRMYENFRNKLQSELLIERERAGLIADLL